LWLSAGYWGGGIVGLMAHSTTAQSMWSFPSLRD
jgi:hypothetical protein